MLKLNCLYNLDCMEAIKEYPDNHFELAIVDPPYGGGADMWTFRKRSRFRRMV